MDERHKKILRGNRSNLVKELEPSKVYDLLLEKRVFTQDMIDEIKSAGTRRDQARQLVIDIETRGSRAFPLFLEILQETGHLALVQALQGGPAAPPGPLQPTVPPVPRPVVQPLPIVSPMDVEKQKVITPITPIQKPSTTPTPSPEGEFLKPKPQRVRRDSLQSYKMDASPCGHCLIINNVQFEAGSELNDRAGSDVDCERLEHRFKELNFIVDVKTNLRQRQIKHELSALSKKDHSAFDCCVVVILSHGAEVSHNRFPGAVYGVDGQFVAVQHITNFLDGHHCPTLKGKPKLFFIQACGGDEKDTGCELSPECEMAPPVGGEDDQTDAIPTSSSSDSLSTSDEIDARTTLPTPSDILVCYSTFPGYVSWRDPKLGSWYVETLDQVLAENAATDDLVTMLMMVNLIVSQNSAKGLYKQMPGSFNFLRKLLYFQPQD